MTINDLNRYRKYIDILFTKNTDYDKEEILSQFLEKKLEIDKNCDNINNLENYVFITIRNLGWKYLKNKRNYNDKFECYENLENLDNDEVSIDCDYEYEEDKDYEHELKMFIYKKIYNTLKNGDKELFDLHFVKKMRQRQISRDADIPLSQIHSRIARIKKKIKEEYGKAKSSD